MKNILLITLLLITNNCFGQDTVSSLDLFQVPINNNINLRLDIETNRLINYNGKPFTGVSIGPTNNGFANKLDSRYSTSDIILVSKTLEERNNQKSAKGERESLMTWKNGVLNGLYESYNRNDNLLLRCYYKKGILDSIYEDYNDLGYLNEKYVYKDGKLNGPYENYYTPNKGENILGNKGIYVNDIRVGPYEKYWYNGNVKEKGIYVVGKSEAGNRKSVNDGLLEKYYENGKLEEKAYYKTGVLNGPYEAYFDNGQLDTKMTFLNGYTIGLVINYYKNGQIHEKVTFKLSTNKINTSFDGLYESFYFNGQLNKRCFYKLGVLNGEYEEYTEDGTLILKVKYINGEKS